MGGCLCKGSQVIFSHAHLLQTLTQAIEEDDLSAVRDIYETLGKTQGPPYAIPAFSFDDIIVVIHGVELNPLALCIRVGYLDIARYLIEVVHCNVRLVYALYQAIGKTPVHILCEYDHLPLLTYFLPLHLDYLANQGVSQSSLPDDYEELSVFQEGKQTRPNPITSIYTNTQTPIQRACEFSHLDIVKFVWRYMKDRPLCHDFDIHAIDERSGENCALIAARIGDLPMMEFLFFECGADFTIMTKRKENALQLAVLNKKPQSAEANLEIIKFLVEKVKLDVVYEYEETLLLCDNSMIQEYIEDALHANGVSTCKEMIEEANSIKRSHQSHYSKTFADLEERARAAGPEFAMKELFPEELAASSAISPISPKSLTPFSVLSRNQTPDLGVKA